MTDLLLGTAQFGAGYGVTNTVGRVSDKEVEELVDLCLLNNATVFDTSPNYGDAQARLGRLTSSREKSCQFVSKFSLPEFGSPTRDSVLSGTLKDLNVSTLAGLLFHRVEDLRDPRANDAWRILKEAQSEGIIAKIGVSVYDSTDLELAFELFPELDLVQIPANLIDHRILGHRALSEFHSGGGTVHARSAYLQGLLLADPAAIPDHLSDLKPVISELRRHSAHMRRSLPSILLGYLKHHPLVDGVVVGVLSVAELRETFEAWDSATPVSLELAVPPEDLLDPRKWSKQER